MDASGVGNVARDLAMASPSLQAYIKYLEDSVQRRPPDNDQSNSTSTSTSGTSKSDADNVDQLVVTHGSVQFRHTVQQPVQPRKPKVPSVPFYIYIYSPSPPSLPLPL
jgi:hypothetical protein